MLCDHKVTCQVLSPLALRATARLGVPGGFSESRSATELKCVAKLTRAGGRERGAPPGAEASPVIRAFRRAPRGPRRAFSSAVGWLGGAVHGQDPLALISQRSLN